MLAAVIMAGGCGTRFWPYSQPHLPKQFLPILGTETMLQITFKRIQHLLPPSHIYVVTTSNYSHLVREQLPLLAPENLIVEPISRETAASIGVSARLLAEKDPDTVMLVLPSDHYIGNTTAFARDLLLAAEVAANNELLITLGIPPTRPETAYGYLQLGKNLHSSLPGFPVVRFIEKPPLELAQAFLASGNYLWNSGIFIWKARTILEEINRCLPQLGQTLQRLTFTKQKEGTGFLNTEYHQLERISIDYGVMEKTSRAWVIPASFSWDDVGSWQSLLRILPSNADNNLVRGPHIGKDTHNCIIISQGPLITTIGLENLIIVATGNHLLVCSRERDQEIKDLWAQIASFIVAECEDKGRGGDLP